LDVFGNTSQKYNYLLETGFNISIAISGVIQTFAFAFGPTSANFNYWGNSVSIAVVDYMSYNQNVSLLTILASGYFGLALEDFPLKF
jgi:hypothetical protein